MTKSFLEIAQEIAETTEKMGTPAIAHCDGCDGEDCDGVLYVIEPLTVGRECELAIEAIIRREFGDSDGPALERKGGLSTTDEAKIARK